MNNDGLPQRLTVGVWQVIDGTLDNAVLPHVGCTDPDAPEVVRARGLRERGWVVSREHPERELGVLGCAVTMSGTQPYTPGGPFCGSR